MARKGLCTMNKIVKPEEKLKGLSEIRDGLKPKKPKPEENMGKIIHIIMNSTWRKPACEVKTRGSPFLCL